MTTWLKFVAVSAFLGAVTEILARALNLWVYTPPKMVGVNIVVTVGLVFGTIAWLTKDASIPTQFVIGALVGIAYEAWNFAGLNGWYFPDNKLGLLKGKTALTIGVGIAWGMYPVLTNLAIKFLGQ